MTAPPVPHAGGPRPGHQRTRLHLLVLLSLCAVTFFVGLASHGVTNWQEGIRVLVAREMQQRGDWIVPTVDGTPYLAKPPMVYWAQIAIATLRAATVGLLDLRLAAAIAATLGVLATYFAARRLLGAPPAGAPALGQTHDPERASLWAAAMLATGILYARSARIGELDILLVPFVVTAVAAVYAAWERTAQTGRAAYGPLLLAAAASAGAALTKGPPALLTIMLAAYGGMFLWIAAGPDARRTHTADAARSDGSAWRSRIPVVVAVLAPLATLALTVLRVHELLDAISIALLLPMASACGYMLGRLALPGRARSLLDLYSKTHPIAVLGVGLIAVWAWGRLASARTGRPILVAAAGKEAADNLDVFSLSAAVSNFEAVLYAVGLGSIAAVAATIWLVRDRPALSRAMTVVIAWVFLDLLAFSILGRGTRRYLTPTWPAVAILGAVWFTGASSRGRAGRALGGVGAAAVIGLAVGQSWWYAAGRERYYGARSPRDFVAELLHNAAPETDPARIATIDFWEPGIAYYVGEKVVPIEDANDSIDYPGEPAPLDEFVAELRAQTEHPYTLLLPADRLGAYLDRLTRAGLLVQTIPVGSEYRIDRHSRPVVAVRVQGRGPLRSD